MQINKKVFSSAITALLILSIFAVAAPAFALDATSVVTLSTATGGFGTSVLVTGPAVGSPVGANPFGPVKVYWDNLGTLLNGTAFAAADGSYSVRITVPGGVAGTHYIIVQDSLGTQASATFTVVPSLSAGTGTVRALPGDSLTLRGNGYAANSAVTVVFNSTTLATPNTITLTAPAITTNATGSFVATVVVPTSITTAQFNVYTINATDSATPTPNFATANVNVNYYITVTPSSAPPGVTTTIAGRIPATTAYILTVDTVTIASGTTDATGRFTQSFTIPALIGIGAHTVTVTWGVTNSASATLTVTAPPTVTLSAGSGVPQQVITITGVGFVARANVTLTIGTAVVNSTAADSRFGPTSATGGFVAEFSIPNFAPGAYVVTVTDEFGASASVVGGLTINAAPTTTVTTAAAFAQGDTISFTITTTDPAVTSVGVAIKDPSGNYWWGTPTTPLSWTVLFTTPSSGYVPYYGQIAFGLDNMHLTLPANAPTGNWNWTVTLPATATSLPLTRTGLFAVNTVAGSDVLTNINSTVTAINTNLNAIGANVTSIKGTVATIQTTTGTIQTTLAALNATIIAINGNTATLSTSIGTITTSINSMQSTVSGLSGSISSINSGVATLQTTLGTVQTSLSSIDAVLGAVAGDTTTIKTSLGTITTSLSSIGTTVTKIDGNVATIQTDLGTLSGTVTSMSGNIATIQTNLGTLQADVSTVQTDVSSAKTTSESLSPLIIVAIVLALIAAIAAIASIVLMRRKIAG